jgi:hypothetical protein
VRAGTREVTQMASIAVYLVFFLGGVIFANFVPAGKFLFLAPVLSMIYFLCNVFFFSHDAPGVFAAVAAFVILQLGYVCGLALSIAYGKPFSRKVQPAPFKGLVDKNSELK